MDRSKKTFAIGGEYRAGDPAAIPAGHVLEARNVFLRPDGLVARPSLSEFWDQSALLVNTRSGLVPVVHDGQTRVWMLSAAGFGWAHGGGAVPAWADNATAGREGTDLDWCMFDGRAYAVYFRAAAADLPNRWVCVTLGAGGTYDESDTPPAIDRGRSAQPNLAGASIATIIRRLVIGMVSERVENLIVPANAYDWVSAFAVVPWVASAGLTIAHAASSTGGGWFDTTITNTTGGAGLFVYLDTITTTAATAGFFTFLVTLSQDTAFPNPFGYGVVLEIIDSASGAVYAKEEFEVTAHIHDPVISLQHYRVTGFVPSGRTIRLRLTHGNARRPAVLNERLVVSHYKVTGTSGIGENHGAQLTRGQYWFPFIDQPWNSGVSLSWAEQINIYEDRFAWSMPNEPRRWRLEDWGACTEIPGPVTAVRAAGGRLFVFKRRGVWIYRINERDPDFPFVLHRTLMEVGCVSPRAHGMYDNIQFFIGEAEVYAMTSEGDLTPLCGPGLREHLFERAELVADPLLTVDRENKEVHVYVREHVVYVYSLETQMWTHWAITAAAGAEYPLKALVFYDDHNDVGHLIGIQPTSFKVFELGSSGYLTANDGSDFTDGTARAVTKRVIFPPIESDEPQMEITIDRVMMKHKISATQVGSTCAAQASLDYGANFDKASNVVVTPLSTANRVMRMPIDLDQTGPSVQLAIEHVGKTGPTYFNIVGLTALINVRGQNTPNELPTNTGETL